MLNSGLKTALGNKRIYCFVNFYVEKFAR